ncbi:MAG: hypothetical protein QXR58_01615 [Candidatus Micrarchaeaceae archaeon]
MITGFTITKVEGAIESQESLVKQMFPKLNINIEKVASTPNEDMVKVEYSFYADYLDNTAKEAKSVGHIKLSGEIDVKESKDSISAILKKWTETNSLPVQLAEEIINGLNFRCSATGTLVAYSLGLIPPLVISTTKIQESKQENTAKPEKK